MKMDKIKFNSRKVIILTKLFFHIANILLIAFYLYPGSILGCFIYDNCTQQPSLTNDFSNIISSNHVYVFIIISLLGLISYSKEKIFNKILIYLFFISVFLEFMHLIIPGRGFEMKDLAGNILGVAISLIIFLIFKVRKKNEQF